MTGEMPVMKTVSTEGHRTFARPLVAFLRTKKTVSSSYNVGLAEKDTEDGGGGK